MEKVGYVKGARKQKIVSDDCLETSGRVSIVCVFKGCSPATTVGRQSQQNNKISLWCTRFFSSYASL